MTTYALAGPLEPRTTRLLGSLFSVNQTADLEVHEDKLLKKWMAIGSIQLFPSLPDDDDGLEPFCKSVRLGGYEWIFPKYEALVESSKAALDGESSSVRRWLEHVAFVAVRTGLVLPVVDPDMAASLPFRRPSTLVLDTSSVIQGGLDFAVRLLSPTARIRVPAVAHMELLCQMDNYFKVRRSDKKQTPSTSSRGLLERACGVGGQRALLRVELHSDAEVERATIGADPLRGIVRLDEEHKALNIEYVQRSFADRLIFETAREHQSRCAPGHKVMLMTCDEGLARMTFGEGMLPFVVRAPTPPDLSEMRLTGTPFHPFNGTLCTVPLATLLWELAVTFGAVRIRTGDSHVEVRAIGDGTTWQPFHATHDLLWVSAVLPDPPPELTSENGDGAPTNGSSEATAVAKPAPGSYKFSLPRMIGLIATLFRRRSINDADIAKALGLSSSRPADDYRGFLVAGGFVERADAALKATDKLDELWTALLACDFGKVMQLWASVPSVAAFAKLLADKRRIDPTAPLPIAQRALTTYVTLLEVGGAALSIPDEGVYYADADFTPADFAKNAFEVYQKLADENGHASTGAWLEEMVRVHGIHPLRARARLEEARVKGFLERFTEGSTPDTRFEQHSMPVLTRREGTPEIVRVHLYHGDFLLAGRASVSLKIQLKEAS